MSPSADRFSMATAAETASRQAWSSFHSDQPNKTARLVTTDDGSVVFFKDANGQVVRVPVYEAIDLRTKK